MNEKLMHMIYPGMSRSVPVIVTAPVTDRGYDGYVWIADPNDPSAALVKVHTSRLSEDPVN